MTLLSEYTDAQLFAGVKCGDHAAFTELYERYWDVLFIHAFKIIKSEEKAMDVVQDIFTGLWEEASISTIHVSLKAFLYTSVRNKTLDAIRRQEVASRYLDSFVRHMAIGYPDTEETVSFNELVSLIDAGVADLPKQMQRIFRMSCTEGQSHSQIADELNITVHTVKKTITRARHFLKTWFIQFLLLFSLLHLLS